MSSLRPQRGDGVESHNTLCVVCGQGCENEITSYSLLGDLSKSMMLLSGPSHFYCFLTEVFVDSGDDHYHQSGHSTWQKKVGGEETENSSALSVFIVVQCLALGR